MDQLARPCHSGPVRLDLPEIESSLRRLQAGFGRINARLSAPRDGLTDDVLQNMMAGYACVDDALGRGLDLFDLGSSRRLLELNTLVHCGADPVRRREFAKHIAATERHFYEHDTGGIGRFIEWLERRGSLGSIWARAAGAYIHVLSQPQLFIEGNHRTGALMMSYLLAREAQPPFVLSVDNAQAYFDPSSLVKDTRRDAFGVLVKLPRLEKRLARVLCDSASDRYLVRSSGDGA